MIKCKSGETKVVQLLLESCSAEESGLNIKDEFGWTPLMLACHKGHNDVVKLLLDHSERLELNATTKSGETALLWFCKRGYTDVVKLFLDHSERIELNAPDNDTLMTALMWACHNGCKDVVQLLLEHSDQSIDLNAKSYNGNTASMIAHHRGHHDIVKMIEAKLSFIQFQNKTNKTKDYDLGLKEAKKEIDKRDREPEPSTPNPAGKLPGKP